MLDFLIVWDRDGVAELKQSEERVRKEVAALLPAPGNYYRAWYAKDGAVAVLLWGRDAPPIKPADRVLRGDEGLRFFDGWLIDLDTARPLLNVSDVSFDPGDSLDGEFTACSARPDGEFRVWRNSAGSMPLYHASEAGRFVLASRASVAAYGRRLSTRFDLSPDFARSVLSASISLNRHSMFEGVDVLEQGAVVYRPVGGRPVVHRRDHDLFFDEGLRRQYLTDRTAFWDDAFDRLRALTGVFRSTDSFPLEVPLSGGKDSRLVLAMLHAAGHADHIDGLLTWGVEGSPEISSAGDVARALGLETKHRFRVTHAATAPSAPASRTLTPRYPRHVFLTEGEMSPMDLTGGTPRPGISVSGQEGGLRNIAGKRSFATSKELLHWFRVHLANWDVCKILTDEARASSEAEFLDYYGAQLEVVDDINQIPSKHRIEFRFKRWVARTWHIANSTSFAPYIFPTDAVLRYTYNSGPRSRSLEEFHFEMLRRADKRLLEIPFAEQTWDPELRDVTDAEVPQTEPYVWSEGTKPLARRPIGMKLQVRLDEVRTAIESRTPAVLDGVVDMERLWSFDANTMMPGHVQPLMHLVGLLAADSVKSFAELDVLAEEVGSFRVPDFDSLPEA
ncbi:hypothetical protein [Myceligenerans pegani]|uniref:Asparagine synthetase domain-containing protein n=1 Tax=Myceligenerans pegani TaxID=2776917 RepID=A0ABR9N0E1_9MICO|nr:hypothetical protein [Myceligenerans sp. TRM 65318]MBE1877125.1 hypothetical protein [Myceligenerans sp. TRM 65318]MBE3019396.1 hypothetical protein [Myceligenerans sp. TRM 65318]